MLSPMLQVLITGKVRRSKMCMLLATTSRPIQFSSWIHLYFKEQSSIFLLTWTVTVVGREYHHGQITGGYSGGVGG